MGIPGFTAQASLYGSLRYYATLPGSDPAWAQPLLAAMPKGGWGPHCDASEVTCGPYGLDCMRTCSSTCRSPGFPNPPHIPFKESRCTATEVCCEGKCLDFQHDPNCGACGKRCSASGLTCCGGECVNLNQNTRNCGKCGRDCRPGSCEAGVCVCHSGHTCGGICCPPEQDCSQGCCTTNADSLELSSFTNFLLFNGCKNIEGLTVSLRVTEPLVTFDGFTLQLNAYNPPGFSADWLQYVFFVTGNEILAQVQYWDLVAACGCHPPGSVCDCAGPVVNLQSSVLSLPSNTIPAGFELLIFLNTDDNERVKSATFAVTDNEGHIHSQDFDFDPSQHHHIRAFEVNVVGPANASDAFFASGAGTITYEVSAGELCVEGGLPERCTGNPNRTAETSNARYGPIGPPCCNSRLSQSLSTLL